MQIKIILSDGLKSSGEDIEAFLEFFFENVPLSTIKFVSDDKLEFGINSEVPGKEGMYCCQNKDGRGLLVFPQRNLDNENYLYLIWESECPHLDGLCKYGNSED